MATEFAKPPSALIEELSAAGIVRETEEGTLGLADDAVETLETQRTVVENASESELVDRLTRHFPSRESARSFATIARSSGDIVAEYLALRDFEETDHATALQTLSFADRFYRADPPADEIPEAFSPIHGDRLPFFERCYETAIAYVWRRDCDPCAELRDDFDEIFGPQEDEIQLVAVYGPAWAEFLQEEYDVGGGPTVLFLKNGGVDARLVGLHPRHILESEIEKLR